MPDFLQLGGKTILVFGVANRKSVAWHVAQSLEEQGARVIYSVRSDARRKSLEALLAGRPVFVCDVEREEDVIRLAAAVAAAGHAPLHGIVHSIAFANYSDGFKAFHETRRQDFLQATAVSAFSLVEIARAFKPHLARDASVVAIGISSLLVTPDNYARVLHALPRQVVQCGHRRAFQRGWRRAAQDQRVGRHPGLP
jgi:enoyl-[acyl-carrier protein] reductase I